MGRDKWTITWLSSTHVNTLQVCTVQKTEKVIYSRTITQGLNFTRSLFSVLLFIYILSQVTDIFLLMIATVYLYVCIFICCMPTVILLYWLILWFTNRSELTSIKGSIKKKYPVVVSDNGFSIIQLQIIIWPNAYLLPIVPLEPTPVKEFVSAHEHYFGIIWCQMSANLSRRLCLKIRMQRSIYSIADHCECLRLWLLAAW